jgi:trimethylguanosine synthase
MMTEDAWFGVTPEPVAKYVPPLTSTHSYTTLTPHSQVAKDLAAFTSPSKTTLIDMFSGAGGNVIAFALTGRFTTILAIERDASVLACAQYNAAIYGVSNLITWINADSFTYLSFNRSTICVENTVVFASPPWGGPGYTSDEIFDLSKMWPYSVKQIHDACKEMDSALYLPRTSDLRQIARLGPKDKKVEVVQYCMEGASKALVAYIPASPVAASSS